MKVTVKLPTEIEISHVKIVAAVNYDEEEIPNDFPGRKGDTWHAMIELDTGKIVDWPAGRAEKMHLTVKDSGTYTLLAPDGKHLATRDENYVPHGVVPGQFGDTIEITINGDGVIAEWPKKPDIEQFFPRDEE